MRSVRPDGFPETAHSVHAQRSRVEETDRIPAADEGSRAHPPTPTAPAPRAPASGPPNRSAVTRPSPSPLLTHVAARRGVQVRSSWRPAQQKFWLVDGLRFCKTGRRSLGRSVAGGALAQTAGFAGCLDTTQSLHASSRLGQLYFRGRILVLWYCAKFLFHFFGTHIFVPGARCQGTVVSFSTCFKEHHFDLKTNRFTRPGSPYCPSKIAKAGV